MDRQRRHTFLGWLEHARRRHAAGEPFARKSVAIRRRLRGEGHPEMAADETALAALLVGQKKQAEAERIYRPVLALFPRVHGPERHVVAVTLDNLAVVLKSRSRRDEAGLL